jgi:magnesium transporter
MSETQPTQPAPTGSPTTAGPLTARGLAANGTPAPGNQAKYVIVVYDSETIEAHECRTFDELLSRIDHQRINWVTIRDVHDEAEMTRLLAEFRVDPFVLVEILDEGRMQFDVEYENCLYLEYTVPYLHPERHLLEQSSGSFVLGKEFLILYEHQVHGLFARTRRRLINHQTKAQQHGPDYLLYLLLRAVIVDHFQHSFKHLTLQLEELEDHVLTGRGREEVYSDILFMREEIKPWNEPLLELEDFLEFVKDAESKFISEQEGRVFTKSLFREIESLLAYYDRLRGYLTEIMSLHMGAVERNTARVNQLLTVIATIFLPITFIASIYGMNFVYMPELDEPWAYPAVLILMGVVALGLIIFMRRRRWF